LELDLNSKMGELAKSNSAEKFIKELSEALEKYNKENKEKQDVVDVKLTNTEEAELDRREFDFLQEYFAKELEDKTKGEIFIVTNKYENDKEYHRYKVAQYKDNLECKRIAFEEDLPENTKIRDVVRKIDEKYIYDEKATEYVKGALNRIKQDIISNRK